MTEGIFRRNLPRFKNPDFRVAQVLNVARENVDGKLLSLMDDTRANYLGRIVGEKEDVYVKAVASPWTGEHGIHLLVIPDRKDHLNIPGIADLSPEALGQSLQLAESLARKILNQGGISEVDFGINHSRDLKRGEKSPLASIPRNLHIHVTGYTPEDLESVSTKDIMESSDLTGRTEEALYALGEGLFFGEIVPALKTAFPSFDRVFSEIRDQRGRKRFIMTDGRNGFQHPDLPKILQAIDSLAKQKYDELAKCFFEFNSETNKFVIKQDESARYQLLLRENRLRNIDKYIDNHRNLSSGVKLGLKLLAAIAKDEQVVMERELDILAQKKGNELTEAERGVQIGFIANRFWAYKDLAYAMVWSAYTSKLVERDISKHLTKDQLQIIQQKEAFVLAQTREEMETLEIRI